MSKNMLIDSAHMEEVRVAVIDGERLDKFDFEVPSKAQIKGNIYLAKVVRVEPSLQAAFVDYGNDRHGFLGFSEIHNDYFQIPVSDRQELEEHIQNATSALMDEAAENSGEEVDPREIARLRYQFYRRYKIQEVIKKRQIMLVQVVKEERGSKCAALTTYISLAGRYCVLMPNTAKGSGVSRKVIDPTARTKLKKIVSGLRVDKGSTVIRTAGVGHTKAEIAKDFNCLKKMWDEIRETTIKSTAPCIIHEEANVIKRAIRDMYTRDVESVFVEGEEGYKIAKAFVKKLMPSHVKRVKLYQDEKLPLFAKFNINDQINQIYSTRVNLPSGGYLVINTTEALVSVDVNSGKSTKERNVAETALKTNMEAAMELARQCRLRDLAGLIVVDFIDMGGRNDNAQVERCLRDALRKDKAKVQIGNISPFGLLEFSRQRLRASIVDTNMITCPHCSGTGVSWSNESFSLQVLRKIEETVGVMESAELNVILSANVAMYLMNHKRSFISDLEKHMNKRIVFKIDGSVIDSDFKIEQVDSPAIREEQNTVESVSVNAAKEEEKERNVVAEESDGSHTAAETEPGGEPGKIKGGRGRKKKGVKREPWSHKQSTPAPAEPDISEKGTVAESLKQAEEAKPAISEVLPATERKSMKKRGRPPSRNRGAMEAEGRQDHANNTASEVHSIPQKGKSRAKSEDDANRNSAELGQHDRQGPKRRGRRPKNAQHEQPVIVSPSPSKQNNVELQEVTDVVESISSNNEEQNKNKKSGWWKRFIQKPE
ncbi:MAG: ribonuclease E/G [Holosporaceae bacterium]|jgi:ribonuclease E|nr:ribonuclease E/G [Holosporaceae bacterium]